MSPLSLAVNSHGPGAPQRWLPIRGKESRGQPSRFPLGRSVNIRCRSDGVNQQIDKRRGISLSPCAVCGLLGGLTNGVAEEWLRRWGARIVLWRRLSDARSGRLPFARLPRTPGDPRSRSPSQPTPSLSPGPEFRGPL